MTYHCQLLPARGGLTGPDCKTGCPLWLPLFLALLLDCSFITAQDSLATTRRTTHATLFGVGYSSQQDTYLSPLLYKGAQFTVLHEALAPTRWMRGRGSRMSLFQANVTTSKNPAGNGNFLGGQLHYDHTWLYNWPLNRHWHLMAGPQVGGTIGVLFSTRNGNNPAQALFNIRLSASGGAIYRFHLLRRDFNLRYHMDFALLGAMFSPTFGQSYYEIFALNNPDHNVVFTHPFNARRFRNQLTLDIPCRRYTLRAGCFFDMQESHVKQIRHSDYSIGIIIGWVRHLSLHKSQRTTPAGFTL